MGAIDAASFDALVVGIVDASFSDDKLTLITAAAARNRFTCAQVVEIIDQLSFSSDQLEALAALRPSIIDPHNAALIGGVFTFSSDRDAAMQMFQ